MSEDDSKAPESPPPAPRDAVRYARYRAELVPPSGRCRHPYKLTDRNGALRCGLCSAEIAE